MSLELAPFTLVAAWFAGVSFVSALLMGWDKRCSMRGQWRVSESTLLFWATIGGAIGAKLGQRIFRHKTRKEPFRTLLNVSLALNVLLAVVLIVPEFRTSAISTFGHLLSL